MDDKNLRAYLAELIGTFALVFISAGAVCVTRLGGLQPWSVSIALASGLIYAGALAITLPISGGYLNPAITIMLWVFRRMDGMRASALIGVQALGAAIAGLALRYLLAGRPDVLVDTLIGSSLYHVPDTVTHLNLQAFNAAGPTLGVILKGIAIELVLTFILVFAVFGLAVDPRGQRMMGTWGNRGTALWLGLILIPITIFGLPLTGGVVNHASWFGPAIAETTVAGLSGYFKSDHAVYWIGPIAGALAAGWLYTSLIMPQEEEQKVAAQASASSGNVPAAVGSSYSRSRR